MMKINSARLARIAIHFEFMPIPTVPLNANKRPKEMFPAHAEQDKLCTHSQSVHDVVREIFLAYLGREA